LAFLCIEYKYNPAHPTTGIRVGGTEKDVSAIPMVISTKENTRLVDDMGGVSSNGILELSTMDCLQQISNTERYGLAAYYTVFGHLTKKDQEAPGKEVFLDYKVGTWKGNFPRLQGRVHSDASHLLFHLFCVIFFP
jgi:hypothetical protein